ncbi:putative dynein intermediate chain 3, ciliary [Operophtera brumata]|uniref:Putative dynein intermediate chain 3, ciliary n=1 Tax=Operophtera brumata TaxID=104452 RepID=A0A0L7KHE8_OPEBR|nr:putative dynein intermediate chain 3, ciliary [Operophtera brumata]
MEISYQYTKMRGNFGRQPQFCEQGPELCDSIPTALGEHKNYILRNPVHQLTQNTPCYSANEVNTLRAEYSTTGANHAEGGWPKDIPVTDPEATQRYRRKIEKDDGYISCVMSAAPEIDHYTHQNNAIDMYGIYYTEMAPTPAIECTSCRTVNVYRDPPPVRPISSICWQPDGGSRFAVTYIDLDFKRIPRAPLLSYIWDVENANNPEMTITPPCALLDLQYNPREQTTLAGGLINGQVAVWDRRGGGFAQLVSPQHTAHRDLVRNVVFNNAKSGQEFFSAGPDGACKWWDIRNMSEPTDVMIVDVMKSSFDVPSMVTSNGVSSLEFEPTMPTRFMAGTENGLVVVGNRKGKTPMEKMPAKFEAHTGTVWSVERNPGFLKNFLTVGDWTARVWSEDCRDSAIVWSPPHRHKITAGTWSPTRLSLLALAQWNGLLALWDLLRRQHEPTLTMQVCEEPLLRLRMHEGILEREAKRERILEARMREIRLKQRQAEEGAGSPAASLGGLEPLGDQDLTAAAAEYLAQVRKEQGSMS